MNLHIDLMLDSERRNAALFNPKSIIRMGAAVAITGVALLIATAWVRAGQSKQALEVLRSRWRTLDTRHQQLKKQSADTLALLEYADEFARWRETRYAWSRGLAQLARTVPEHLVVQSFTTNSRVLKEGNDWCREFTVDFGCRTSIEGDPDGVVKAFQLALMALPGAHGEPAVLGYHPEGRGSDGHPTHMVFTMHYTFRSEMPK